MASASGHHSSVPGGGLSDGGGEEVALITGQWTNVWCPLMETFGKHCIAKSSTKNLKKEDLSLF